MTTTPRGKPLAPVLSIRLYMAAITSGPALVKNPVLDWNPSAESLLAHGEVQMTWVLKMSKKTMSVHCPVCNVSSPRDLSELARPSGQSCLICGALFSDYAWGELATALLAVQQLSDHFRANVSHAR